MPDVLNPYFTIIVDFSADQTTATMRLTGDLDVDARPELAEVISRLESAAPAHLTIDLSGVAFAGAVLPNFLAQLLERLPVGATVSVTHPSLLVSHILGVTGISARLYKVLDGRASPSGKCHLRAGGL